jgi:phosphoribosylamine-glycine ligase
VLFVTALGPDLVTARQRAYDGVGRISFAGMHNREDIAA